MNSDIKTGFANNREGSDIFEKTAPLNEKKKILESIYIKKQLDKHDGDFKKTAEALGILVNNLYRKLKEYNISG